MRPAFVAALVLCLLVPAGTARAATLPHTASCLRGANQIVETKRLELSLDFPEIQRQLFWKFGRNSDIGNGTVVMFTKNEASARHLYARLARQVYALGADKREIPKILGRVGNAIWDDNASFRGLTTAQKRLLVRCLS